MLHQCSVTYGRADAWFHIRLVSCRFELDKTAGISGAAPEDCNRLFRGLLVPALRVPQQKLGMSGCISVDSGADSGTPGPSELHLGTMDAMDERGAAPSRRRRKRKSKSPQRASDGCQPLGAWRQADAQPAMAAGIQPRPKRERRRVDKPMSTSPPTPMWKGKRKTNSKPPPKHTTAGYCAVCCKTEDCMWRCFEGHIVCNACGLKLSRAKREQEGF
ncbi:hypothetical protein ACK3TF_001250 [Chlorella vulgaris]